MAQIVQVTGWDDLLRRFADAPAKAQNVIRYNFGRFLTFLRDYARREKLSGQVLGKNRGAYDLVGGQQRWRRHPGQLKKSLTARFTGELEAEYDSLIYGKAWEFGFHRKRYFVKPTVAKALVWYGGGGWVFDRKGHWIPAQTFAARPWMRPAYEETKDRLKNMVAKPLALLLMGRDPGPGIGRK